jgi:hypothetical protein
MYSGYQIVGEKDDRRRVFLAKVPNVDKRLFLSFSTGLTDKDREGRRVKPRAATRRRGESVVTELIITEDAASGLQELLNLYFEGGFDDNSPDSVSKGD